MPTKVIPVKMTQAESDLLDWLMRRLSADSRSQALRMALVEAARVNGLQPSELAAVRDQRVDHLPRRSPTVRQREGYRERGPRSIPECA